MLLVGQTAPKTVLIVDDEDHNFFSLAAVLKSKGYRCLSATSPLEAAELLDTYPEIKVVLMDLMMPGMDGYDGIQELRQHENRADVPIIVVTAMTTREAERRAMDNGADGFLTKPVDVDALVTQLERYMS